MLYELIFLEEAVEFIQQLDFKMRIKTKFVLDLLQQKGNFLTEPYSKSIKGQKGLKELRIKSGSNICRIFYFHKKGRVYVIANGYIKKSQKTKPSEIKKAVELMKKYMEVGNE